MSQLPGDSKATLDSLSVESVADGGGDSSRVLGTYTQRFKPKASFAFLHLLPIFHFQNEKKMKPLFLQDEEAKNPELIIKNPISYAQENELQQK